MDEIRLLSKEDIDVRVAQTATYNDNGQLKVKVSLLLYKDARVDMKIMDELFTPMGWQREHEFKDGKLYCRVSVYSKELNQWIAKEDVGVESNTEAEKGQASDSFKRACVNWGIGRELYTAPKISVELTEKEYTRDQNSKIRVWASFSVKSIGYDTKSRTITSLEIQDRFGNVRFSMGAPAPEKPIAKEPSPAVKARRAAAGRGASQEQACGVMTPEQFRERWNSDANGGGITYDDIAECAKAWGLCSNPRTQEINFVREMVLRAAGINWYTPMSEEDYWKIIKAYSLGMPTKTGGDYRQTWIETTHAGKDEIAKFDHDVENFKYANQLM